MQDMDTHATTLEEDIELQQLREDDIRADVEEDMRYQKVLNTIRRNMPAVTERIEELLEYYEDNGSFDMSDPDWAVELRELLDMAYNDDEEEREDYQYE